jgi:hypothetical protein
LAAQRWIAAALERAGHVDGSAFNPRSVKAMVEGPVPNGE